MAIPAGIYLHWPFCERKCPYCEFYTFGREHPAHARHEDYLAALVREIESAPDRLGWSSPPRVDTLYFGGGTPSLMGPRALERLLRAVSGICLLDPGAELTLEVNPTTAEAADLPAMLALGINRLSIGCQSFNDRLLRQLGRVHDAATTRRAIESVLAAGRPNLSLDLIFGVPTQTLDELLQDLAVVLALGPDHVSAYGLTLHEGTPYARWAGEGRLPALPDDDAQGAMYESMIDGLAAAGFEHYEISNWALPGRASRHNSKYWRRADVFGFGVAAHGVAGGRRFENPRDLAAYIEGAPGAWARPLAPPATERARRGEIMMLALRRVAGAPWSELTDWLGADPRECYAAELRALQAAGLLTCAGDGPRLTRAGLLVADRAMEEFF